MSQGPVAQDTAKKDKDKKGKDKKKKEGWHLYSLFKKTKGFDRNVSAIPPIVREPIEWLISHNALGEEGIFRIPGSATEIKDLKMKYDKGKKVDLATVINPHTVAGLLKVFFRELPEPLLTFELYDAFLAAIKPESVQMRLDYLAKVLDVLPAGNKIILEHLMEFLFQVSLHKTNCMSIPNIAIVFAPNLMRPKVEKIESILTNSSNVNLIIGLLIQHHEVLFHGKELQEAEAASEVVLSPHLISLKQAQAVHGSKSNLMSDDSSAASNQPPVSPIGKANHEEQPHSEMLPHDKTAKKSGRKTPGKTVQRSATVSTPSPTADRKRAATTTTATPVSKSIAADEFAEFSTADIASAALALQDVDQGAGATTTTGGKKRTKPKRMQTSGSNTSGGRDDQFFDTLKKGTMKLAANLLEEHELVLEMAELEGLSPEERAMVQNKVAKKINESNTLRDTSRKQRKQLQRTQTSNFTKLRELSTKEKEPSKHKRATSSGDGLKSPRVNGDDSSSTVSTSSPKKVSKHKPKKPSGEVPEMTRSPSQIDSPNDSSETSSVVDVGVDVGEIPELAVDPALLQFEDELDQQFSLEEDTPLDKLMESDDSEEDNLEEQKPFYDFMLATLPPPISSSPSVARVGMSASSSPLPPPISGDAAWVGASTETDTSDESVEEEERVIEAVMEGDMQHFQQYLGDLKRKKRLERSISSKKVLSRMVVVSPPAAASPSNTQ